MAFPERDRRRGKRESGESAKAKRCASGGLRRGKRGGRFFPLSFRPSLPPPSIFSLPRLSLSSPPPLANDLALMTAEEAGTMVGFAALLIEIAHFEY